jgi:hypothetical protein
MTMYFLLSFVLFVAISATASVLSSLIFRSRCADDLRTRERDQ